MSESALPGVDKRAIDVWCTWLDKMATDAEAALAAAIAYQDLDGAAREVWLTTLEQDAKRLSVPRIAVYAPLLAVESDPARRRRITDAIGPADARSSPQTPARGLRGTARDGTRVAAVVCPLYLEFVQVLACGYAVGERFEWVNHDPIVAAARAPQPGEALRGVVLETMPLNALVDELALTVVAHARQGRNMPEGLSVFADLFGLSPSGTVPSPGSEP